ncbi:hypothetical protein TCAL_10454 [Tigriopus californicus]|uniref:Uncharacterized protein n=1 Tax=Tigriopus californicus TaxID=6832 RepID=A0A553PGK4_TIGCA|nr:guanine nucleotide-binding protein subunit alpha-12-like [Tigriopus californicus]TRY76805.1 hypothetical protein TCAL_10454 [Tigriopus californicus]
MGFARDLLGCGFFRSKPNGELDQRNRSKQIDKQLRLDRRKVQRMVKLLLLGAGESGKSTFLKQMRIIHGLQFDANQIEEFKRVIYQNIVRGMQVLASNSFKWGYAMEHAENEENRVTLLQLTEYSTINAHTFGGRYHAILSSLWRDQAIQQVFERRSKLQVVDSVGYFLNNLDRVSDPNYVPTNQDILYCRKTTKGIIEFPMTIENVPFLFVDVGGQRTQRQKWFECFDSVTAILFMASTSEFDQVLLEDSMTNRLEEARTVFSSIVNNKIFKQAAIILFLNKMDLLKEKVCYKKVNIAEFFPLEFEEMCEISKKQSQPIKGDPLNLDDVKSFILYLFVSKHFDKSKPLYHHFTTAVDTRNIEFVFNSVKETILRRNLDALMLE